LTRCGFLDERIITEAFNEPGCKHSNNSPSITSALRMRSEIINAAFFGKDEPNAHKQKSAKGQSNKTTH
jgi:hypothetical protein